MPPVIRPLTIASCALLLGARAEALTLRLDYSYDASGFFSSNPAAKVALAQAACDLGALLSTSLGAVGQTSFWATQSGQSATVSWTLSMPNPRTGSTTSLSAGSNLAADTVTFYVGSRALTGSLLAESAVVAAQPAIALNPSSGGSPTLLPQAVAASNATMGRSTGPIMGSARGSVGGTTYALAYGALGGSLWFDDDFNNDRVTDTPAVLAQKWQFDPHGSVGAGQYDFYSVALQGMLRGLGLGTSEAWTGQVDGSTWLGQKASALFGSGEGLLLNGQVNPDFKSAVLGGGGLQSAVLAPGLQMGERRMLTALDSALLQDIGYSVVPEPGSALLVGLGSLALGSTRRGRPPRS